MAHVRILGVSGCTATISIWIHASPMSGLTLSGDWMNQFLCATIVMISRTTLFESDLLPNGDNAIAYFGCYLVLLASIQVWGSFSFNIPPLVYNSYA